MVSSEVAAALIAAVPVTGAAVFATVSAFRATRAARDIATDSLNLQSSLADANDNLQTKLADLNSDLQAVLADKSREAELVVSSLDHLVGGSQERTAGLAALRLLKSLTPVERWTRYEVFVRDLLSTQLIFVLTEGRNRWEAHEAENARMISAWLLADRQFLSEDAQVRIRQAVERYAGQWGSRRRADGEKQEDGGRANAGAVRGLIASLAPWLSPNQP